MREIFERIEKGYSKREIADYFNTLEVPSPSAYYYIRENRKLPRPESNCSWSANTLSTLISNPVYVGDMVQGKRRVASFKTKKRKCVPQEEWIVVRNTHSPIVDRDLWEKVQRPKTNGKVREPKYSANTKENLFKGLIRCGDCGATLSFNTRYHYGEKLHFYRCANYLGKGKNVCSSHCISEDIIKNAVLADIRKNAKLAADEEDRLRQELLAIAEKQLKKEDNSMQVKLEKKEKRIKEINMLVRKLFEENVSGIIPADMLESMVNQYHDEKTSLDKEVEMLKHEISKKKKQKVDVDKWTENMLSVLDLKELDRDTVLTLVDHIEVYEGEEVNRKKQFSLHIHYKFLGPVDTTSVGAA